MKTANEKLLNGTQRFKGYWITFAVYGNLLLRRVAKTRVQRYHFVHDAIWQAREEERCVFAGRVGTASVDVDRALILDDNRKPFILVPCYWCTKGCRVWTHDIQFALLNGHSWTLYNEFAINDWYEDPSAVKPTAIDGIVCSL
jgi:hypothetical protein